MAEQASAAAAAQAAEAAQAAAAQAEVQAKQAAALASAQAAAAQAEVQAKQAAALASAQVAAAQAEAQAKQAIAAMSQPPPQMLQPQMMQPQMLQPQMLQPQMMQPQMQPQIMQMQPQMMQPQMQPQMMQPQMMQPQQQYVPATPQIAPSSDVDQLRRKYATLKERVRQHQMQPPAGGAPSAPNGYIVEDLRDKVARLKRKNELLKEKLHDALQHQQRPYEPVSNPLYSSASKEVEALSRENLALKLQLNQSSGSAYARLPACTRTRMHRKVLRTRVHLYACIFPRPHTHLSPGANTRMQIERGVRAQTGEGEAEGERGGNPLRRPCRPGAEVGGGMPVAVVPAQADLGPVSRRAGQAGGVQGAPASTCASARRTAHAVSQA